MVTKITSFKTVTKTSTRARLSALALSVLLLAQHTPSQAQTSTLLDATNVNDILEIAKTYGSAEMQTTSAGDPQIVGRIDNARYVLFFEGCKENLNCRNLQFYAGWAVGDKKVSSERINEWNRTKRWGKAYLDREGDPAIELDVNLYRGVSRPNFDDTFDWWKVVMKEFRQYIGE